MTFIIIPKGSIEQKPTYGPSRCPNINLACLNLVENMVQHSLEPIKDLISKVAHKSVDIWDDNLFAKTNTSMQFYINLVDCSPLTGSNYTKMLKIMMCAQELYFNEQLKANLRAIIQNALVYYVESIEIHPALPCKRERIIAFVASHIEIITADDSKSFDSYKKDLNDSLANEFFAYICET